MNELVIFWSTLQWQPIFFWAKSTVQYSPCSLHAILLVGAASIRQKGQYCYAGHSQINYLTRWTQENQLTDQLTIINRRRGGIIGWANDRLCLASSYNTEAINGNRNTVECRYCYAGRVSYSGKSYTSVWCLSVPSATHQGHHWMCQRTHRHLGSNCSLLTRRLCGSFQMWLLHVLYIPAFVEC